MGEYMPNNACIADTLHGSISISKLEKNIMSTIAFNRLHDIYQNSTVYLTFPCNRTKRFEHSIGTMKLCSDMFYYSICNSSSEDRNNFLLDAEYEIKKILNEIKTVKNNEYHTYLDDSIKNIIPEKIPEFCEDLIFNHYTPFFIFDDSQKNIYLILFQSIRIAAMLHDIGHPPFSHVLEKALTNIKEFVESETNLNEERAKEFNEIMDDYVGHRALHEVMGDKITDLIFFDIFKSIKVNKDDLTNYYLQLLNILIKEIVIKIFNNKGFFKNLHSIIDGTIDGDRLDYITRDYSNSGLKTGIIEYDRLIPQMKLILSKDDLQNKKYLFCFHIKSLNTIQDILTKRLWLYKNILFHHKVARTDYLLRNIIEEIAKENFTKDILINKEQIKANYLPLEISGLWQAIKHTAKRDREDLLSQWNDSWVINLLKAYYFQNEDLKTKNKSLYYKMQEFLTSKKHYLSATKRIEDYLIIDNACKDIIKKEKNNLILKIKELKDLTKMKNVLFERNELDIQSFLKEINDLLKISENKKDDILITNFIKIFSNKFNIFVFEKQLNNIAQALLKYFHGVVWDTFVITKNYKSDDNIYLYEENFIVQNSLEYRKRISKTLEYTINFSPQFYIYLLNDKEKKDIIPEDEINQYLQEFGRNLGLETCSYIIKILDDFKKTNQKFLETIKQ